MIFPCVINIFIRFDTVVVLYIFFIITVNTSDENFTTVECFAAVFTKITVRTKAGIYWEFKLSCLFSEIVFAMNVVFNVHESEFCAKILFWIDFQ